MSEGSLDLLSFLPSRDSSKFIVEEISEIGKLKFNILPHNEILSSSVCEVFYEDSFESKGVPKLNGLFDPRMGVLEKGQCWTCGGELMTCMGHFGHIELVKPVYNNMYITDICNILKCICISCSRLRIDKNSSKYLKVKNIKNNKKRLHELIQVCKDSKACFYRDSKNPENVEGCCCKLPSSIKVIDHSKILFEYENENKGKNKIKEKEKKYIQAEEILITFKLIEEEDYYILGCNKLNRPEWLIWKYFPVPPPCMRPSNMANPTTRGEDYLTDKLVEIVRQNNLIKNVLNKKEVMINQEENIKIGNKRKKRTHTIQDIPILVDMLQYQILAYTDYSSLPQSVAQRFYAKNVKSLKQRLKGKEGRLRGNLMGKRVNYTARSVITPDPNIKLDEVGVPKKIARILTVPEKVNDLNIIELKKMILRGPFKDGGANFVETKEGDEIDLRMDKGGNLLNAVSMSLKEGMTVKRHLKNRDLVLMNRQPSLHKFSIMAHYVRLMEGKTFRLNLSVTTPYNADFDGDEMNMQVPQTYETRGEAMELIAVGKNILTPQLNGPVMGLVQDTLLALRIMTIRDTFLNREEVMQICGFVTDFDGKLPMPCILAPRELWSGKQIFNTVIPNITYTKFSSHHDMFKQDEDDKNIPLYDTEVLIKKGELLKGLLCKKSLGSSQGSLIHFLAIHISLERCIQFFNDVQLIGKEFLKIRPFSLGLDDIREPKGINETIDNTIKKADEEIKKMQKMGMPEKEFEKRVNNMLNKARNVITENTMKNLGTYNAFFISITSGAKGNSVNPSQIIATVGQQNIEGGRTPNNYNTRTLVYFEQFDLSAEAKGFIRNSFIRGLNLHEFIFQCQVGRDGLTDMAIKTSDTGYMQRKICKVAEDCKVEYDGTIRNSKGEIISFVYADDSMDATYLENQNIKFYNCTIEKFNSNFLWNENVNNSELVKREKTRLKKDLVLVKSLKTEETVLPVNFIRLLENLPYSSENEDLVTSDEVIKDVILLQKRLWKFLNDFSQTWDSNFALQLRWFLASKSIIQKHKMTRSNWKWLNRQVERLYCRSIICPGEMVGTIAGTSIGERQSQMTLKTFHFSGISEKDVTLGIPRFKELLDASKNPSNPSLIIYLEEMFAFNENLSKNIMKKLKYHVIKDFLIKTDIYFDPKLNDTIVNEDKEFIKNFYSLPTELDIINLGPKCVAWSLYILRLEFDSKNLLIENISLEEIKNRIEEKYSDILLIESTNEYTNPCVIRLRILYEKEILIGEDLTLLKELNYLIPNININGIKGIEKCFLTKDKTTKEYIIETQGSNLSEVFKIEGIDKKRTKSNNVYETMNVLGIEASLKLLIDEIKLVISFDGTYINSRHYALISEILTHRGLYMAANRHGLSRIADSNILILASFEETAVKFSEAGRFEITDPLKGITAPIIIGKLPRIGTCNMEVLLDIEKLSKIPKTTIPQIKRRKFKDKITRKELQTNIKENAKSSDEFIEKYGMNNENLYEPYIPQISEYKPEPFNPMTINYDSHLNFNPINK